MSIYRNVSNILFNDIYIHPSHAARERTKPTAPPMSDAELHVQREREEAERSKRKQGEPLNVPLPRTRAWFAKLPHCCQPHELMRLYARIANHFAVGWDDPDGTRVYLDQLLMSYRPNRQGFPEQVQSELLALRRHYIELHPESFIVWHGIRKR